MTQQQTEQRQQDQRADWNAAELAWVILLSRPDATEKRSALGPYIEIRRNGFAAGDVSDGTRVFIVDVCSRWRWLRVVFGWQTLVELDQRDYFQRPADLAAAIIKAIDGACPAPFPEELTPIGVQLVFPGCERTPPKTDKPQQLGLW